MSPWIYILSAAELKAHYALTAKLDPRFAKQEREFYEGRTVPQLHVIKAGAWNANELTSYQLARSYLALKGIAA
jgi:hypothetical protein